MADQGLEGLSESALRERHAAHLARIVEIRDNPDRTIVEAREARTLAAEANEIGEMLEEMLQDVEVYEAPEAAEIPAPVEVPEAPGPQVSGEQEFVEGQEQELAEAVAASARLTKAVIERVVEHVPASEVEVVDNYHAVIASASHGSTSAGQPLSLSDIGAMAKDLVMDRGRVGTNVSIMTAVQKQQPVMRADQGAALNTAALAEWLHDPVTAATFTPCGPPDILRNVPECLNTSRYVDGWFRNVPTDHGAIQFYRPLGLADVVAGTRVWGQTEQAAITTDPTTWKPCATIACVPTTTVGVEEIVQCLCMPVFNQLTSPETVGSALAAARAQLARTADGHLLDLYDALVSKYTFAAGATTTVGAVIDLYDMLGRLMGATAAANRNLDWTGYTLGIEAGLIAHLTLDALAACNPRVAQDNAEQLFGNLGLNIKVTPDWANAAGAGPYSPFLPLPVAGAGAVAVPARPTSYTLRIFHPDDFGMMTPGTEELGVVPDLDAKRQNKVCWFGKQYQGLAKLGCRPAYSVAVSGLAASGVRMGCATPS